MSERLHPESMRQLRALVKLHGAAALEVALRKIKPEGATFGEQENLRAVLGAGKSISVLSRSQPE